MKASDAIAAVGRVQTIRLGDAQDLPAYVRRRLGPDHRRLVVVAVSRADRHYRLLVDFDWLRLASETARHRDDLVDGLQLPRAAIVAVLDGWGTDQDRPATTEVYWDADGIPHVSKRFAES